MRSGADECCDGFCAALGAAPAFVRVNVTPAPACGDADLADPLGILNLSDVVAFTGGFIAMQPISDLNSDGVYDLSDVVSFVDAFAAGCP
jgi:hypothetical protein